MIKIAFAGKKESGKTTLARYCDEEHELDPLSFADSLKMQLTEIGIDPDRLYTKRDPNSRKLMQAYGAAMRDQDEDYWLNILMDIIDSDLSDGVGYTIDDLRHVNEAVELKKRGFTLVKVIREGFDHEPDDHVSENDLMYWVFDYVIRAKNGDTDSMFKQVDAIIKTLKGE